MTFLWLNLRYAPVGGWRCELVGRAKAESPALRPLVPGGGIDSPGAKLLQKVTNGNFNFYSERQL